jgi:hypothetical protein
MSDRLAVMNSGIIEQVGSPREEYDEPANTYVADFLGLANLLPAFAREGEIDVLGRTVATATNGTTGNCYVVLFGLGAGLAAPGAVVARMAGVQPGDGVARRGMGGAGRQDQQGGDARDQRAHEAGSPGWMFPGKRRRERWRS